MPDPNWLDQYEQAQLASKFWGQRHHPRVGIMLHYDASKSDAGSLSWFGNPACKAGYHFLAMDAGKVWRLAPFEARVWHAGYCSPSDGVPHYEDANSQFIGIAIAATVGDFATYPQVKAVAKLCREIMERYGWPITDTHRITTHAAEAVYGPTSPRAGERGRKSDPGAVMPLEWVVEALQG